MVGLLDSQLFQFTDYMVTQNNISNSQVKTACASIKAKLPAVGVWHNMGVYFLESLLLFFVKILFIKRDLDHSISFPTCWNMYVIGGAS